jgi:CheY-specific phosphatase CheX
LRAISDADRKALDRALAIVVEESFFVMLEPVSGAAPVVDSAVVNASVTFDGSFSGSLTCHMPRTLVRELTATFIGDEASAHQEAVNDLAGEFANMVCGRWLTDIAPNSMFCVHQPVVGCTPAPSSAPAGLLHDQPIWIDLKVER